PAYATMLLCQPPPSTNHSPYTTLFRAGWAAEVRRMQAMASSRINGREADQIIKFLAYDESHRKPAERDKATVDTNSDPSPWESRDRKSTRLNSSHQISSYAVLCLKKNK